ncbi:proline transporter 2-like [Chenopodium quinoa]|uniref:proline transporter 2-like n=1 Tax=Chenopodium quinoa TaxID=63459 RepID=UPI000B79623B|nr:proline transporter 2-like [Chenopodium quinoa]
METTIITEGRVNYPQGLNIETSFIKDEQVLKEAPISAHAIGNDSWQQVSLLLVTGFNCGWILSFSNLMMVPLGWTWGIVVLVLIGLASAYANWLLAGFHFIQGQRFIRYRDIMGHLFGKHMYYVTCFLQFSTFVLTNMGYILLGGRSLKEINLVFSDTTMRLQYFIIITAVTYFLFSFTVPNLSALRIWLGAATILTFTYIVVILVTTINDGKSNKQRDYEVKGSTMDKVFNALAAISAIVLSSNSGLLPELQSTLRKPVVKNMRKALYAQFTFGIMVYYGVTLVGYWAYGSDVPDYLPKALSGPKWAKILINSAVFLTNVISQHMFFQPVHEALDTRFLKAEEGVYSRENLKRRFLLRALLFAGTTVVAAALPFMGYFISLLGSFTLVTLTFIFPSMIFIKVKGKSARIGQKAWHWTIIFIFSLVAMATTIASFILIIHNVRSYHFFADQ